MPFDEKEGLSLLIRIQSFKQLILWLRQNLFSNARNRDIHCWIARRHCAKGNGRVAVEWRISNNKFGHGCVAYVDDVLILCYEIVDVVRVRKIG